MRPKKDIHVLDKLSEPYSGREGSRNVFYEDKNLNGLAMFIELMQRDEKSRLKVKITFNCAKIKSCCPKINIELPKTCLVYYTTTTLENTLALVFLKKNPDLPYFVGENDSEEAFKAFDTAGNITISAVEGTPPSYNRSYRNDKVDDE